MKALLSGILLCTVTLIANAQIENAAFTETGRGAVIAFATDYQSLGINPANLAWGNEYGKRYTLGFAQFGMSFYSESFTRKEFTNALIGSDTKLTLSEKMEAGHALTASDLSLNADVTLVGGAVNTGVIGNFAFSISFSNQFYGILNEHAADQLFTGYIDPYFDRWVVQNPGGGIDTIANQGPESDRIADVIKGLASNPLSASELYAGTAFRALSTIEYSIGYGYTAYETADLKFSVGAGLKYIQGLYFIDVNIDEDGTFDAFTASTPALDIDYGSAAFSNPSAIAGSALKSVGSGFGFDLGLNLELEHRFRLGLSVVDIGFLTFDGNVYTASDTAVFDTKTVGIDSYNIFGNLDAFVGDDGMFKWAGEEERNVALPTQMRLGFGYFPINWLRFGLDVAVPLNDNPGNPDQMSLAAGMDLLPVPAVRISAGAATGANYGFRVPVGLNFILGGGGWEMGVATRDVLYAFRDDRPNLSAAFGFLRYRIGDMSGSPQSQMFY